MADEKNSRRRRGTSKKVLIVLLALAWLGGTGFLAYSFVDSRKETKNLRSQLDNTKKELEAFKTNPEQAAKAEVQRIVGEVGKLYALPEGEEPSVATVSDKSKLADQPFFAKAENGDVTLIYANAKLAILYRPTTKQIVNVSAVTIDNTTPAATPPQ